MESCTSFVYTTLFETISFITCKYLRNNSRDLHVHLHMKRNLTSSDISENLKKVNTVHCYTVYKEEHSSIVSSVSAATRKNTFKMRTARTLHCTLSVPTALPPLPLLHQHYNHHLLLLLLLPPPPPATTTTTTTTYYYYYYYYHHHLLLLLLLLSPPPPLLLPPTNATTTY